MSKRKRSENEPDVATAVNNNAISVMFSDDEIQRGRSVTGYLYADDLSGILEDQNRAVQQNDHNDPIRTLMTARGVWIWPLLQPWQKKWPPGKWDAYEDAIAEAYRAVEQPGFTWSKLVLPPEPMGYDGPW